MSLYVKGSRIEEGDWIRYRHHEGYSAESKVLEIRPDDKLVVGEHDHDPSPNTVDVGDVFGKVTGDS